MGLCKHDVLKILRVKQKVDLRGRLCLLVSVYYPEFFVSGEGLVWIEPNDIHEEVVRNITQTVVGGVMGMDAKIFKFICNKT